MPFSRITYTYSGQSTFAVNFTLGYLSQSHVTCRINDEVDGVGDPAYRTLTWITSGTVSVGGAALVNGDTVVFERTTPKNIQQHDYQDGALLIEENLDESFLQAIMIAHEALDGRLGTVGQEIDMGNNKIINLAPGVDDTDAATVEQLNDTISTVAANLAAAQAAQTAAELAETNAETAETNAETAQAAAEAAQSAAETAQTNAETAETNAATSAALAEDWAEEDEDVEVTTGKYSAKHWAAKAEGFASGSADAISYNNATSGLTATDVQEAIDEIDNTLDGFSTYETGDIEPTFRSTPKSGFIFIQEQTLGDTGSGADLTGASYQDLYEFIWNNIADTDAPVSTGRGASASADWSAGKTIQLPDTKDATPFGVGTTWARVGQTQGNEEVNITKANLPNETLSVTGTTNTTGAHTHTQRGRQNNGSNTNEWHITNYGDSGATRNIPTGSDGNHSHTVTGDTEAMGSGTALSILPKGFGVNWMIKL